MRLPTYQELSKEQLEIYSLPLRGSFLVTGPPGTGKTVMALYRAQKYGETDIEPQLLMFNNTLKDYTRQGTSDLSVSGFVDTFHRWFRNAYPTWSGGRKAPEVESWVYDWKTIMPVLAAAGLEDRPAVLIDEAQDLPSEFFTALMFVAEHSTIFADENQRIKDTNSTLDAIRTNARIKPDDELLLTRNYRNTLEIAQLARHFYAGLPTGMPKLPGRSGEKPVVKRTDDAADAVDFIARYERTHSHQSIGVLVPNQAIQNKMLDLLRDRETKNTVQFYSSRRWRESNLDFGTPGIQLLCYASAKGLEWDTLFLPELQAFPYDPNDVRTQMSLYVMLSRPRNHLHLLFSGSDIPPLLQTLPDDLIDQRL